MFFSLKVFTAFWAPKRPLWLLAQMCHLIMPCQPLLSGIRFVTANYLTSVHRLICMTLCMSLKVLLSSECLITITAIIHTLHFHTSAVMFKVLLRAVIGNHLAILLSIQFVLGKWGKYLLLPLQLLGRVAVVTRDHLTLTRSVLTSALDIVTMAVRATRKGRVIGWPM